MKTHRIATVCGLALVSLLSPCRADWSVSNVDAGLGVGYAASLVLDPSGVPHVSYFRPNSLAGFSDLAYATRAGSSWSTESIVEGITNGGQGSTTSIVVTELGKPAVSFTRSGTFVRYSIRTGGSWISPVDVSNAGGGYSSMVWRGTEAAPAPQVAFNDGAANDLRVAVMNAGTFSSQALDTSIAAGASCSLAQVGAFMGVAYIDGSKLGYWQSPNGGGNWGEYPGNSTAIFTNIKALVCSLALAPTKNNTFDPTATSAHILYFDNVSSSYKYVTNDTENGLWSTPEVVFQSSLITITQSGCSIAIDSAGGLHAAFLDYDSKRLGYSKRTASGWSTAEFVEGSNLGGAYCTIQINADGQPCIGYAGLTFDTGSMSYQVNGLRFAEFSSTTPPAPVALSFAITGKTKRATSAAKLTVKGTASASATSIQWRLGGKGKFRTQGVAGGAWSVKVTKLAVGKNVVQFRAGGAGGQVTAAKKLTITRD